MSNISHENGFRTAISELDSVAQGERATRFTGQVPDLSDDNRIANEAAHGEREAQYTIPNEFLSKRGLS